MQYTESTFFSTRGTFIIINHTKGQTKSQESISYSPHSLTVKLEINNEKITREAPYL